MSTDPYREQVEKFKKRIEKVPLEELVLNDDEMSKSLPSRSEVHGHKKKKKKKKLKFPLIRALLIFFILLPIAIISYSVYSLLNDKPILKGSEIKANGEEISFEIEDSNKNIEKTNEDTQNNKLNQNDQRNTEEQKTNPNRKNKKKQSSEKLGTTIETKEEEVASSESMNGTNQTISTPSSEQKIIYHTVQPKETLFSIAMKYYHSQEGIEKIKQWNNIANDDIMAGQVLQIHLQSVD
ncbi:LysM peptidoglycan-binding domain-containing protein [Heyndrickxia sp. NPDC080065]|uniref:LysM peptidoglycan-binding domain-containing protein n=1 Tax=Heyndrickxia sp. NPDC080065 TaxID=3390568 RepID=UPI003CFF08EA